MSHQFGLAHEAIKADSRKRICIDLYAGLGGWAEGFLAEGYDVIGFDIERHEYGDQKYPGILCIQSVLTLHGSQFKDAALIVASPPCQGYSYRAMPWRRAKACPHLTILCLKPAFAFNVRRARPPAAISR